MLSETGRFGDAGLEALAQAEREVVEAQRAEVGCLALILVVAGLEIALLCAAFG